MRLSISKYDLQKYVIDLYVICIFTTVILENYLLAVCVIGALFWGSTIRAWGQSLRRNRLLLCATLLFVVEILYRVIGISTAAIGNYANRFLAYISVWMGIYICTRMPKRFHSSIVKFAVIVLLLNVADNVRLYELHTELIGTGSFTSFDFTSKYGVINLGKTSFNYMVLFLSIFLLCGALKTSIQKGKLLLLLVFVLTGLYLVIYGGSGTIFLSYLVGVVFILLYGRYTNSKHSAIKSIFVICLFLVLLVFSNQILGSFIKAIEPFVGAKVASRLMTVLNLLNGNLSSVDLNYLSRIDFMVLDMRVWFSSITNFFIGNGYHTYSGLSMAEALAVTGDGGHSGFLDLIARYGIIGLIISLGIICSSFNYRRYCNSHSSRNIFLIVFMLFLINNIFNNVMVSGLIFIVLVFYPLLLMREKDEL